MNGTAPSMTLVRQIVAEEAAHAGIKPEWVFTRDRRGPVAWARARVCKRLRETGRYSLPGIGKQLGIDHSTVLYSTRRDTSGPPPRLNEREPPRLIRMAPEERARKWFYDKQRAKIIRLFLDGLPIPRIAKRFRYGRAVIVVVLSDAMG